MRYTVVWTRIAEEDLALLWTSARNRSAITEAANRIDRMLAQNPNNCGESREQGRRIVLVAPLAVTFRVSDDDRMVRVLRVWAY